MVMFPRTVLSYQSTLRVSISVSKDVIVVSSCYPLNFTIDSAIHKARPDIHAAAHCHSIHGKAWSVFGKPIETLTQDSCMFYDNHGVYNSFNGVVLAEAEGENIARALGPKWKTCILQNHGLLTC